MSDWYYAANNEQKGPINESELKAQIASGKIPGDTLVWKDGMDNWTAANQVPAFSFRAAPAPAANQPDSGATMATTGGGTTTGNPSSTKPVDLKELMGKPEALEVDAEDAEKHRIFGILAYLGILCVIPIIAAKDSPFAKYHANQGLVLFVLEVVIVVALQIINYIVFTIMPGISILLTILSFVWIGPLILFIYGIVNAAWGRCVPLPVIGGIRLLPK